MSIDLLPSSTASRTNHQDAAQHFQSGRFTEAALSLGKLLIEHETSELWNDWATAEFALGRLDEAEHGFRRALELNPRDAAAAGNLAVLLIERQRFHEAIPLLQQAIESAPQHHNTAMATLLARCQQEVSAWLVDFLAKAAALPSAGDISINELPRWPLHQLAMRLVQQGELRNALELMWFNRHFQPADLELIKIQACVELLLKDRAIRNLPAVDGSHRSMK